MLLDLTDHPWAQWAVASLRHTHEADIAVIPNLGGSLPNEVFADVLGLPTIWVPHSYAGCSQHAPNEHILEATTHSALAMTGLWWDLGDGNTPFTTLTSLKDHFEISIKDPELCRIYVI